MSLLLEIVGLVLGLLIWLFASPIIFGTIQAAALTGPVGFIASIFPWVILLAMIGRLVWILRTGGAAL